MISDAQELGDFRAVVAYDLSRFGRMDSDETGYFRHLLKQAGVSVRFSNENDGGDNETGEIIRPVLQAQKRQYLRQISRDTLRGQLQAARAGWASGRAAPFGFDRMLVDEVGKQRQRLKRGESYAKSRSWHVALVPSDTPGEVEALRWIFHSYLGEQIGCRELARRLNEKGVKAPQEGTWGLASVKAILQNPAYKGDLVFGRRAMGSFHRVRNGQVVMADGNEGHVVNRPEEEWVVHRKPEMALVSKETWDAVNAKLASRGDRCKRAHARKLAYPLGGMICCADCGAKMVGMYRDRKYQIYACATHFRNKACFSNTIRQEGVLAVLKKLIQKHLFSDGNLEAFKAEALKQAQRLPECQARDVDKLRRELAKAKQKHQRAAENLLLADAENVPVLNSAMTSLRQEVKTLEAQLEASKKSDDPKQIADGLVLKAEQYLGELLNAEGSRLKGLLSELIERIELRFDWGKWGNRRVRLVTGGDVYLKSILTTEYRGDRI
jgi:site-specific DNA recombinase